MLRTDEKNQAGTLAAMPATGSLTEWVGKGEAAFSRGDLEQAATCFNRALEVAPWDAKVHNKLSLVCWRQGKTEEALNHLVRALELDPDERDVISNCCSIFQRVGKATDAEEILQAYLVRNPWDQAIEQEINLMRGPEVAGKGQRPADFFNEHGEIRFANGDLEHARACFEMAIDEDPEHASATSNLGVVHWQQGRMDKALEHFNRALDFNPQDPDILLNSARALRAAGELETAADLYRIVLELHGSEEEVWDEFTTLLKEVGASRWQPDGLAPEVADCYLEMGVRLAQAQDLIGAAEVAGRALRIDPDKVGGHYLLATLHRQLGQQEDALEQLLAGLAKDSGHKEMALMANELLLARDDKDEAAKLLDSFLAVQDDEDVRAARAALTVPT